MLTSTLSGNRYLTVSLGHTITAPVHILVARAFLGDRPPGQECCHFDDIPTHNTLAQHQVDTPSANKFDAVRNGRNHWANRTQCPAGHP